MVTDGAQVGARQVPFPGRIPDMPQARYRRIVFRQKEKQIGWVFLELAFMYPSFHRPPGHRSLDSLDGDALWGGGDLQYHRRMTSDVPATIIARRPSEIVTL